MRNKSKALILLLCLLPTLVSGCWSRKEIETLAFVTALALDKEGEDILVTVQIAIPQSGGDQGGGGDQPPVWTVTGRGRSIGEAVRNLTRFVGRAIYLSHVRVIIMGEELAKQGIGEVVDYLNRHWQLRGTHWIAVAKGKGSDILNIQPKLTRMPAFYIGDMFGNASEYSLVPAMTWLDFIRHYSSTAGVQPYAPVLHIFNSEEGRKSQFVSKQEEGDEVKALSLEQVAVFKGDKLIGWLNNSESRGLLWLQGKVERSALTVEEPLSSEGIITELSTFASSKIIVKPKGDSVSVEIKISQEGNLLEQSTEIALQQEENIQKLNREVTLLIKREAEAALFKLQKKLDSDIVGISEAIRQQQPEIWKNKNWEKEFSDLDIKVSVTSNLRRTGRAVWPTKKEKPWK